MDDSTNERFAEVKRKNLKYRDFFSNQEDFDCFLRLPLGSDYKRFEYIRNLLKEKGVTVDPRYRFTTADDFHRDLQAAVVSALTTESVNILA